MKLTLNCSYREQNGAEIVTVEKAANTPSFGNLWMATLVDGTRLTAFGSEIAVSA